MRVRMHTKAPLFLFVDAFNTRIHLSGGDKINSFISWIGGKKALRDEILLRFPVQYTRYIEVFGGGGWVLFHKLPGRDFEVYNDFNGLLTNLYQCVRDKPDELKNELRYMLNSRRDFLYIKETLHSENSLTNVQKAAYFYALVRYSYGSGAEDFASQPHSIWNDFPLIDAASARLQKVIVENKDFEKLITQYDRDESFFYCDPPYYKTENYYMGGGFGREDHKRLADVLCSIKGKFLLSYNDCEEIRELYNRPGILIEGITRLSNLAQRYESGKEYPELFISNYDTCEFLNSCVQLSLFKNCTNQIIAERKIIYDRLNENLTNTNSC